MNAIETHIPEDPCATGFALVVTLSLMILLTIIAVGLLTLSSISLRSSSQGEAAASRPGQRPAGADDGHRRVAEGNGTGLAHFRPA